MHPLVQSAIDAANLGENNRALEFLKQALAANPNDVDAWLVVAAVVDQPERKRQCLNRVLALDPTNQIARDELLDMDRAAMGGTPPFVPEPVADTRQGAPVSQPTDQLAPSPSNDPTSTPAFEPAPVPKPLNPPPSQAKAASKPSPRTRTEKPLVFKYSIVTRILVYVFTVLFACLLLIGLQEPNMLLVPCSLLLLMLPAIWIVSAQVEVSEKGIRTSRLFGLTSSRAGWGEIAHIKSNSMRSSLELITKKGNRVKVTSQVSGYPAIIEMLQQKRPDLFGAAQSSVEKGSSLSSGSGSSLSTSHDASTPASTFSGTKTFRKSFIRQYGLLFIVIPLCFFAVWTAVYQPENRTGALLAAGFCAIMTVLPFFQVNTVRVEPNKLMIGTFFEEKAFSARQIREIKMQSVRRRYGRVTNFVNIILVEGKNYPLEGFSAGEEIIYGFLTNWWNTYRNR